MKAYDAQGKPNGGSDLGKEEGMCRKGFIKKMAHRCFQNREEEKKRTAYTCTTPAGKTQKKSLN
jgi:hypothetical protein